MRSVTFTRVNAMVFSDVEDDDSGQATAANAVFQQISLATGVAVAGTVLDLAGRAGGRTPALGDFHLAFFVVAAISALSTLVFFALPADAGDAVSGHRRPAG